MIYIQVIYCRINKFVMIRCRVSCSAKRGGGGLAGSIRNLGVLASTLGLIFPQAAMSQQVIYCWSLEISGSPCDVGTFCNFNLVTIYPDAGACDVCKERFYCPDGFYAIQCPVGSSSIAGSSSCQACPYGYYASSPGSLCTICPIGYKCSDPKVDPVLCRAGTKTYHEHAYS